MFILTYTAGGLKYWKRTDSERVASDCYYHKEPSASVEMTSYALLAYLISDDKGIVDARPVVRWMNTQRSALGGYSSTQVSSVHILTNDPIQRCPLKAQDPGGALKY